LKCIRNDGYYLTLREPLIDLGYNFTKQKNKTTLENMKESLIEHFYETKSLKVPRNRTILMNETDYPVPVRGKQFYNLLSRHREKQGVKVVHNLAQEVAKVVNTTLLKDEQMFQNATLKEEILLQAFETYLKVIGSYHVPYSFVVPFGNCSWPQETWSLQLGHRFSAIKSKKYHRRLYPILKDMGYNLLKGPNQLENSRLQQTKIILLETAFMKYKEIYNVTNMPVKYIVPEGDIQWPEVFWGMKLGYKLNSIRNAGAYSELHETLRELGFQIDKSPIERGTSIQDIKDTLIQIYLDTGSLKIEKDYIVPLNDHRFPASIRGKQLGSVMQRTVCKEQGPEGLEKLFEEVREIVNADDFDDNPIFVKTIKHKHLLQAFETYMRLYDRSTVEFLYIIPSNNDLWSKSTWGMHLGRRFQGIRNKGFHKHLHSKLEEMGYDLRPTSK
jgi:hypothetical protein